jgi:UDP-2-acetamido-2,6-beta-L-arabino-hexul-4-ose reductase
MNILITGANGFIGKNLKNSFQQNRKIETLVFNRENSLEELDNLIQKADMIFHIAGENRPNKVDDFYKNNTLLTKLVCDLIKKANKTIPIIFSSSTQATEKNPYGESKLASEIILQNYFYETKNTVIIYRLPGIFGKLGKPNYNSVINTFCYNIANNLKIEIHNPSKIITVCYIDDLVNDFLSIVHECPSGLIYKSLNPLHSISIEDIASQVSQFSACNQNSATEIIENSLSAALYATYLSYLPRKLE